MTTVIGTDQADTLAGTAAADLILGLGGQNVLSGGEGGDTILGGDAGDHIDGDLRSAPSGFPSLPPTVPPAGEGNLLLAGAGNDLVTGGLGTDTIMGGNGKDTLYGGIGTSRSDFTEGGYSANWSLDRADLIEGDDGDDLLDGAGGNDTLLGGAGNDTLLGSADIDLLEGGAGRDRFQFVRNFGIYGGPDSDVGPGKRDVILDFQDGQDVIDLSALGVAIPVTRVPGAVFLGENAPFRASFALQVRTVFEHGNTIIQLVSANQPFPPGSPTVPSGPEAEIELIGIHHLSAQDFILG